MHRAHVARTRRAHVGLTVDRPSRTFELLFYFFEIKLLIARGSNPESISRNVKTRFQMFINFRNVVILLLILYILVPARCVVCSHSQDLNIKIKMLAIVISQGYSMHAPEFALLYSRV
jgi:hypothetical protein